MKMVKFGLAATACGAALAFCSCNSEPAEWNDAWVTQDIVAAPAAAEQMKIDGEISVGEWDDAQAYNLVRPKDWGYDTLSPRRRKREDTTPLERGFFKVKYDSGFLYVLAVMDDADVVQTSRDDQARAFETGDVIEVFLKPEDKSAVWEICGTPWNKVTTLFYPWAGHSCREQQKFVAGVKVAALAREIADPEKDKAGWTVEMAIPGELIEQADETFAPDKGWRILLVRRNCGSNLPMRQVSSTPMMPGTDLQAVEYYAKLKFKPAPAVKKAPEKEEKKDAAKAAEVKDAPVAKDAPKDAKVAPEVKKAPEKKEVKDAKSAPEVKKAPEKKAAPKKDAKSAPEVKKTSEKKEPKGAGKPAPAEIK
jgi:hypothetical protein